MRGRRRDEGLIANTEGRYLMKRVTVTMNMVLLVGNELSAVRMLRELIYTISVELHRRPTLVLTASTEAEVLKVLSDHRIEILIASYDRAALGYDLIRWLNQAHLKMKMFLVASAGDTLPPEKELHKDGVDGVIRRPFDVQHLKLVLDA